MTEQEVDDIVRELHKQGAYIGVFSNGEEWGIKFRGRRWVYSWIESYDDEQGEKIITLDEVKEMLKAQDYNTLKNGYLTNSHSSSI